MIPMPEFVDAPVLTLDFLLALCHWIPPLAALTHLRMALSLTPTAAQASVIEYFLSTTKRADSLLNSGENVRFVIVYT